MGKRLLLSVISVFVAWSILDFLLHGVLLQNAYKTTASLWRPMADMNMPLIYFMTLVLAGCFAAIYGFLVAPKSLSAGLMYGALFGLAGGVSMGFGSYCYMPIPFMLAASWFFGSWIKAVVAGAIVGSLLKEECAMKTSIYDD